MADFRYGFFVRPDNKKIESHPEEKSITSHISDPKSNPARVNAEVRRQPTVVLPRTRYVTTTEKYTEEVHTKKYEPVKNSSLAKNQPIEFNKLLAKAQKETRQPSHEMRLSEPMNDIGKAIEYFKEAVSLHSGKNNVCSASNHHKEAARRYGKFEAPVPMSSANVATIDCKEAARKYKGATV